jgi:putative hydrolase of the HAD superfamily
MIIKADSRTFFLFDLDDTLYNEIDFLISGYKRIAAETDPASADDLFRMMLDTYRSGNNTFKAVIEKYPGKNLTIEKLLHLYRNHIPDIVLRDGVLDMFGNIKKRQGRIGLITNGRSITQRNKINALGISLFIDEIMISEESGFEKPDVRIYDYFGQKYPGFRFLMFGDNVRIDFVTPRKLNWYCIGIKDIRNIHAGDQNNTGPDFLPHEFINSFGDIKII